MSADEDVVVRLPSGMAADVAVALRRFAEIGEANGAPVPRRLMEARRLLLVAVDRRTRGAGCDSATDPGGVVVESGLVTCTAFGDNRGCSPQYVRREAAAGRIPGARRIGRNWMIPLGANWYPKTIEEHDDGPEQAHP